MFPDTVFWVEIKPLVQYFSAVIIINRNAFIKFYKLDIQIINNIAPETSPVRPCINSQKISCEGIFWIMKDTEILGSKSIRNLHLFAFVSNF